MSLAGLSVVIQLAAAILKLHISPMTQTDIPNPTDRRATGCDLVILA